MKIYYSSLSLGDGYLCKFPWITIKIFSEIRRPIYTSERKLFTRLYREKEKKNITAVTIYVLYETISYPCRVTNFLTGSCHYHFMVVKLGLAISACNPIGKCFFFFFVSFSFLHEIFSKATRHHFSLSRKKEIFSPFSFFSLV